MLRLLFGGAVLLAGLLYFLFSAGTGPGEQASASGADDLGAESTAGPHPAVSATSTPRALRMSGEPPVGDSPEVTGAGEGLELSVAAAFAVDAPGDVAVASEREGMIRGVISDLVEQKVGAASIARLECRAQHCMLKLGGEDEGALVELLGALQDERGFLGKCENIMLAKEADTFVVYLRFAGAASGAQGSAP